MDSFCVCCNSGKIAFMLNVSASRFIFQFQFLSSSFLSQVWFKRHLIVHPSIIFDFGATHFSVMMFDFLLTRHPVPIQTRVTVLVYTYRGCCVELASV
jgi:hypothetical protein